MVPLATCEYPRCTAKPLYTFVDDIATPHFCSQHKSPGMMLANGVTLTDQSTGAAEHVPVSAGGEPSQASLELAYNYFQLKPEYDRLENAKNNAAAHQRKLDDAKHSVKSDVDHIHATSKAIELLEKKIESQDNKLINCFGKSLFGFGILMKDNKVEDTAKRDLQAKEEELAGDQKHKATAEKTLEQLKTEQAKLDELVEVRLGLEARIQEMRSLCLEYEGTTQLRRLQSQQQSHRSLQESLKNCRSDVASAHHMFQEALQIQATAARSNAMAGAVNLGQALGGGGGPGIGQSPGERLLQMRRNMATKQSIELAQRAAEKLNLAQDRLNNDLRVNYPEEMANVGIIQVPDLWSGAFFRDFLVGQLAGNFGDAINQGRAMVKIRRNMEELETIINQCAQQEAVLANVSSKLDTKVGVLKEQVFQEERSIIQAVLAKAEKAHEAMVAAGGMGAEASA